MPLKKATSITLTKDEKNHFTKVVRSAKSSQQEVKRAKIILAAAEGKSNRTISKEQKLSRNTVTKWRDRFSEARIKGLQDLPRSGRPSNFSP